MTVSEKVAYLKGLAEGLGIKDSTNEGKLMLAVIDVLESILKPSKLMRPICPTA